MVKERGLVRGGGAASPGNGGELRERGPGAGEHGGSEEGYEGAWRGGRRGVRTPGGKTTKARNV